MLRKIFINIPLVLLILIISSCKAETVPLIESTTKNNVVESDNGIVSSEKIKKPTIDLSEIIVETTNEVVRETTKTILESSASLEENTETTPQSLNLIEEAAIKALEMDVAEDDRVYHGTNKIETEGWVYGMTPCEWTYVEPGIQLISNYKPNTSTNYSANGKVRVSSGLKGCYIPIFRKTDMMGNEFEGRFYVFEDYKKSEPCDMLFDNSLHVLKYKGMPVEEIIRKGFPNLERLENGVLKIGDSYLNIIYVTDLDKIINAIK